ncbi:MAG: hypothetical protein PVG89_11050 [Gammaproteobacteria bacterium]|jgi:hypothetical protein
MSHENSIQINQDELASQYRRHVQAKSSKGMMNYLVKALVIIFLALVILTGATFALANFSPTTYAQAKDIVFANVDIEKITGVPDSTSKEFLDSWLMLNSEKQQNEYMTQDEKVPGAIVREEQTENQPN